MVRLYRSVDLPALAETAQTAVTALANSLQANINAVRPGEAPAGDRIDINWSVKTLCEKKNKEQSQYLPIINVLAYTPFSDQPTDYMDNLHGIR